MSTRAIAFALLVLLLILVVSAWEIIVHEWRERTGAAKWVVAIGFILIFTFMLSRTIAPTVWGIFS